MAKKKDATPAVTASNELMTVDMGEHAGAGYENVSPDELLIPFLNLLQDGSKQVKGAEKLEGAKVGMFFNTVTKNLYTDKDVIMFVPAYKDRCFIEWVPRKQGGGYVGRFEVGSTEVDAAIADSTEFGKYKIGNNDLVETYYIYGVLSVNGGSAMPVCIAMTSTKITPWKAYFTSTSYIQVMNSATGKREQPPLFAHRLFVTSCSAVNKKSGDEYKNIVLTPCVDGDVPSSMVFNDDIFNTAAAFSKTVMRGEAKIDNSSERDGEGTNNSENNDPSGVFNDGPEDDIM